VRKIENNFDLVSLLSLKYDMDILDITPVKNVVRVSTKQGDKCLKKVRYDEAQFLFVISAMKHLINKGFKCILPFIPTVDGNIFVKLRDGYGFLTEWISSRECDYSNPIELRMAALTLAKLHNASEGFCPPDEGIERIAWGRWEQKFSKRIGEMYKFRDIIDSKENPTYFDRLYRANVDYFISQGVLSIEHLKQTSYLRIIDDEMKKKSFCHHDFAHHNVLISDDFSVYIIDFDYCICDTRLHDLSSLIIRNMRHGNYNMEKAQYIVDCYTKEGTLKRDGIPVMNAFMEFPQDFWQVGLQYYVEKLKWEEDHFNKRLERVIDDIHDRQLFIDDFQYSIEV
jgi:spore coat protein, CotS family